MSHRLRLSFFLQEVTEVAPQLLGKTLVRKFVDDDARPTFDNVITEVYDFLRKNLSKAEGREYVKKVRSKMPKYEAA